MLVVESKFFLIASNVFEESHLKQAECRKVLLKTERGTPMTKVHSDMTVNNFEKYLQQPLTRENSAFNRKRDPIFKKPHILPMRNTIRFHF